MRSRRWWRGWRFGRKVAKRAAVPYDPLAPTSFGGVVAEWDSVRDRRAPSAFLPDGHVLPEPFLRQSGAPLERYLDAMVWGKASMSGRFGADMPLPKVGTNVKAVNIAGQRDGEYIITEVTTEREGEYEAKLQWVRPLAPEGSEALLVDDGDDFGPIAGNGEMLERSDGTMLTVRRGESYARFCDRARAHGMRPMSLEEWTLVYRLGRPDIEIPT